MASPAPPKKKKEAILGCKKKNAKIQIPYCEHKVKGYINLLCVGAGTCLPLCASIVVL